MIAKLSFNGGQPKWLATSCSEAVWHHSGVSSSSDTGASAKAGATAADVAKATADDRFCPGHPPRQVLAGSKPFQDPCPPLLQTHTVSRDARRAHFRMMYFHRLWRALWSWHTCIGSLRYHIHTISTVCYRTGDYAAAITWLKWALKERGPDAELQSRLGLVHLLTGDTRAAAAAFKQAAGWQTVRCKCKQHPVMVERCYVFQGERWMSLRVSSAIWLLELDLVLQSESLFECALELFSYKWVGVPCRRIPLAAAAAAQRWRGATRASSSSQNATTKVSRIGVQRDDRSASSHDRCFQARRHDP